MGEVCGEGGGVSCNVASAEAIFMYLLDRCEVCVRRVCDFVCSVWLSLNITLSVVKCMCMCVCVCGGRGLRLCCLWICFLYVTPSDGW